MLLFVFTSLRILVAEDEVNLDDKEAEVRQVLYTRESKR